MERPLQFSRSQQLTGDDGYNHAGSSNSLQGPWPVSPTALPSSPTAFPVPLGSASSAPMFDRLDVQQPMFPDAQRDDYIESSNASTSNASIPNSRHYAYMPNVLAQEYGIPSRRNFDTENNTEYLRNLGGDEARVRKPEYTKRMTNNYDQPRRDSGYYDDHHERAQTQDDSQRYTSLPKDAGASPSSDFRRPYNHAAEQEYARDYSRFHSGSPRQAPHGAQEEPHSSPYGSKNSRPLSTSGNVPPMVDYSDYYNDESVSYRNSRRKSSPPRNRARHQTRPPTSDSRDEESWKASSHDSFEGHDDFRAKPLNSSRRGRRKEQRAHSKIYNNDRPRSPDSPRVERGRVSRPRSQEDWRQDSGDESSSDSSRSDRWRDRSSGRRRSKSKDRYVRTRSKSRERIITQGRRSRSNSAKGGQRNSFEKTKEKHQQRVPYRQNKAESYRKGARAYQDDIDLTSYSSLGTYEGTSRRPDSRYLYDDDDSSSSTSVDENPTRRRGRHHKIHEKEDSSSESSESRTERKSSKDEGRTLSKNKQNLVESIPKQQKSRNRSKSREKLKKPQKSQYEVSFSPSTDVPKENFEVLEEAPSSCSSIERYAQRMSDANLMKEQSEARHQILSEIRQANAMRMTATSDFDKRFWDKQIRTLNESLKKLFIQQGMVLNAESLLQNFEEMALEDSSAAESAGSGTNRSDPVAPSRALSATTIKVRAPEDLPEGHRFTVRVDGKPLTLKVPEGGVSKGDFFSIQLAQDENKHRGTSTPSTAVVHKSPSPNSSAQEDGRQAGSFSNHSASSSTIQVRAPTDLPEGYKFKATRNGQQILATVPKGGARKGEVFVAAIEKENQL